MAGKGPKSALSLPTSYRKLFALTYRTNFLFVMRCSLWITLFALPLLALVIFQGIYESAIAESSGLEGAELRQAVMSFRGYYGFALLLGGIILSIGLAGVFYAMRCFLRNEGSMLARDIRKGIRKNALGFMGLTAFFGGILALFHFALNLCASDQLYGFYGVFFVLFCVLCVLIALIYGMSLSVSLTYNGSFFQTLRTSFVVAFAKLPYTLLSLGGTIIPLLVCYFLGIPLVLYVALAAYALLGFGHSVLLSSCVNLYCLDETINKKSFPEIYRMGLFDSEDGPIQDEGFQP